MKTSFSIAFICGALLTLLPAAVMGQRQNALPVVANFKIEEGSLDGSYLVLENLVTGQSQTLKGISKFNLNLPFNQEFLLSFHKPGYITKKIQIDTRAPADRIEQGFYPVNFDVFLFKQYEGVNIVVFNQPVARYKFNRLLDEIFYDTDYTKQIQSAIRAAEDELKQKREDERKNAAQAKRDAEKAKADSLARLRQEQKLKADSIESARKSALARAEEERKARLAADEEARRQARSAREEDERKRMQARADEQQRNRIRAAEAEEERKRLAALARQQEEEKRKARAAEEAEKRKQTAATARPGYDVRTAGTPRSASPNVTVEEITEDGRTLIRATVVLPEKEVVYLKIIYRWGGVFYFKDKQSISENMFRQATGIR